MGQGESPLGRLRRRRGHQVEEKAPAIEIAAGPKKHDEQRREDAEHQGEHQLHRCGECLLLGPLTPLDPHLVGLDPEHPGDGDTEGLSLDHGQDEGAKLVEVGPDP